MFNIKLELQRLPQKPGVYLMKDTHDKIIYVGKSVNLKQRVRQYFQESSYHNIKTKMLAAQIASFEYIITETEIEALILENNLIKTNKPRYNIALKDDKTYHYIKITASMYPKVVKTRTVLNDNAKYFGPYSDFVARETLELIHNIWPIRTSNKVLPRDINKTRPCLNYHIGKCLAPCIEGVSEADYNQMIGEVIRFLEAKYEDLIKSLEQEMQQASEHLNFEKAATLRDRIVAVRSLNQKQSVENVSNTDQDILALAHHQNEALVQIFFIRGGKMTGRESIFLDGAEYLSKEEALASFIQQFYSEMSFVPREIILASDITNKETLTTWLKNIRGSGVKILVPQKGDKHRLAKLAEKNATVTLEQFGQELKRQQERTVGATQAIATALGMAQIHRIEAYDISNTQGTGSVGSMVVFEAGRQKTSDYRKFKIKTVEGPDDYASLREVISRRFKRYLEKKDENFSKLPDAIFVDGGKGQVSSVQQTLDALGITIPVCGMVKDEFHKTKALLYQGEEILFPKTSEAFKLITRIQDEVHRFAIEYHKKLRKESIITSMLDEIEGVGTVRKNALFKTFGSIERIKSATLEELEAISGFNKKVAEKIFRHFNS